MPDLNANDAGLVLEFVIRKFDDNFVDITGGTIRFKVKQINTTVNKINTICTITTPLQGRCKYTTISTDLNTTGVYDGELEVTIGSQITTIPLGRFKINTDLPN